MHVYSTYVVYTVTAIILRRDAVCEVNSSHFMQASRPTLRNAVRAPFHSSAPILLHRVKHDSADFTPREAWM
jgi:hypothetical protein